MNKKTFNVLIIAMVWLALVSACAPQVAPTSAAAPTTANTSPTREFTAIPLATVSPTPIPETPLKEPTLMNQVPLSAPYDASVEKIITQAKDDLAKQIAVDVSQVEVVDAASVTWPDASLGCPKPGMAYAQVMVDGILIHLRSGNQVYAYHGGGGRAPFLCK